MVLLFTVVDPAPNIRGGAQKFVSHGVNYRKPTRIYHSLKLAMGSAVDSQKWRLQDPLNLTPLTLRFPVVASSLVVARPVIEIGPIKSPFVYFSEGASNPQMAKPSQ